MLDNIPAKAPDVHFMEADDPFALFSAWMEEASVTEPNDPNAMALATSDSAGLPDCRMVLLKGFDARGFVFYTNEGSAKGRQLAEHPQAAVLFHWKSLRRQVRARGPVTAASEAESDAYFASRSRNSRLGALASLQSRPLASRQVLEDAVAAWADRYPGENIPRPEHWRGYRIGPVSFEFWQDGAFRLHDRLLFVRDGLEAPWRKERLYP